MASETLVVRRVTSVDLRGAVELLVYQQRQLGREVREEELRPAVQAVLEDSDRSLMVGAYHEGLPGFAHGKMVGMFLMHVLPSLEHAGEVGWIQKLYVRPDYRKKGLGERLLSQGLEWAEGRGLRALDLEVGETDLPEAAEHLYAAKGFRKIARTRLSRSR
ncbi:MAG: GNAT family N-acetyltransferase [Polyangia bacterium]|jgi:ribosomal protein S18 acetylase RimI-like enzyme